ncbi:MAG: F420-non-reducing hydrogenase iron-sulfur subunit [Thermoproteota archaeon]|nr:F420-non-reducing hydrogenase iron-sulfur subunit [Thermoproteota archaeon]
MSFKPKIVSVMCNFVFCQNSEEIASKTDATRINCIGMIDPVSIIEIMRNCVEGVMLFGCKPPDCHYVEGNLQAERTVKMLQKLLSLIELEPERIELNWISPMGDRTYDSYERHFSDKITSLATYPMAARKGEAKFEEDMLAAKRVASDFRLRTMLGIERKTVDYENVYGEKISSEQFDDLLDEVVSAEFVRCKIRNLLEKESLSVKDMSKHLNLAPQEVLRHIVTLRHKGIVAVERVEGTTPIYASLETN